MGASLDIKRLERLALIRLGEDEEAQLAGDIEKILDFFRQLDRIDLSGVEPLFHVIEKGARTRDDATMSGIKREWLENSAARSRDGYVVGPRTITGEEA
ncbi:MAG: Asp-tRNA(Asn)/Glu-tRNA(Gln) amidotransferase subunit GatC [Desulfurococcales archaeon]|jgi:aspartyl-tRNA(Asn)/glutamyl-tRNA(Gln) amidotransferase subunit C|nr:Asp-tRNA(Asn)/Glu-tRNA(Gln) amidotransferase subunit GatC [Desulfurococcales archaeon]